MQVIKVMFALMCADILVKNHIMMILPPITGYVFGSVVNVAYDMPGRMWGVQGIRRSNK